jgi:NAD(P)-dependent dehydrogenase (short-subunit alcohol dehydrogenase family)
VRVRAIDTAAGEDGSDKPYATTPAEISAAIRFLFSDTARVVNGERIGLHGGV